MESLMDQVIARLEEMADEEATTTLSALHIVAVEPLLRRSRAH